VAEKQWKKSYATRLHRCESNAPDHIPDDMRNDDIWICPTCRRRWQLLYNPVGFISEGETFRVGDWSLWRSFRCRFIGRIWF
jgi:hypothetical protein